MNTWWLRPVGRIGLVPMLLALFVGTQAHGKICTDTLIEAGDEYDCPTFGCDAEVTMTGGYVYNLTATDTCQVEVHGGEFIDGYARGQSTFTVLRTLTTPWRVLSAPRKSFPITALTANTPGFSKWANIGTETVSPGPISSITRWSMGVFPSNSRTVTPDAGCVPVFLTSAT